MPEPTAFWLKALGDQATAFLGAAPSGRSRTDEGGWLALTGEDSADLNMGCVLRGPHAGSLLEAYVQEAARLPVVLMVEELTDDLLALAKIAGAQHVGEVPVMAWHGGSTFGRGPGAVAVRPAQEPADFGTAVDLIAEAFSLDLAMCRRAMEPVKDLPESQLWLGTRDGEPVGAGMTTRSDDVVGVYCMATPERYQRQGIGHAVLDAMMDGHVGAGSNATRFVLGATPAGRHLYEQVGYEVVGTPAALVLGSSTQFH